MLSGRRRGACAALRWESDLYRCGADGVPSFIETSAPTDDELHALLQTVITRLMTYSIPVPDDARTYMNAVLAHPFMQDWAKGAREEEWIIPRFERSEQGA